MILPTLNKNRDIIMLMILANVETETKTGSINCLKLYKCHWRNYTTAIEETLKM